MPCHGYGLPAKECNVGSMLRKVPGSTCEHCYAMKGNYQFSNVQKAMYKRLDAVNNSPTWVRDMEWVIGAKEKSGFFRWHDSGDLQSIDHLSKIVEIARRLPRIKFWLPTREQKIVDFVGFYKAFPANLVVRVSAAMVNGKAPERFKWTSGVVTDEKNVSCPAPTQGNKCLSCRRCWDKRVTNVNYALH